MTPQTTSLEDLEKNKEKLKTLRTTYAPDCVKRDAMDELSSYNGDAIDPKSSLFKALTLNEFDNGMLLTLVVPEEYKTFVMDMSQKLQKEYNCQTVSEKATCEVAALSYVRMFEAQRKLNNVLSSGILSDSAIEFLSVISKEIDRASRYYFTALQTLRMMKQAPIQVTIKAQTAIVGQHQIVQTNTYE